MTDAIGPAVSCERDPPAVFAGGDVATYGEVAAVSASFNTTALAAFDYTRDALGRLTSVTETVNGTTTTWEYGYDVAGRLVEVTKNGTVDASYAWDDNSNRVTVTTSSGTTSAAYDAQDRLVSFGDFTYGWTKAGELESKLDSVTSDAWSYTYDELGNLVSAQLPNGDQLEYVIDGMNRRIGKTRDGVYEQGFLYQDGLNPVAELDGSNVVVATFVYGTRANVPDLVVKGGVTYRVLTDHLGSVRLVVNTSTGTIAQEMAYDVWGSVVVDTNPGFQPFGFAGGLYDRDLELVRFGARDYDPYAARWTAKDPILFGGGDTNLYGYVLQDPVNWVDPSGLLNTVPWNVAPLAPGGAAGGAAAGGAAASAAALAGAFAGGALLGYACFASGICDFTDWFFDDEPQAAVGPKSGKPIAVPGMCPKSPQQCQQLTDEYIDEFCKPLFSVNAFLFGDCIQEAEQFYQDCLDGLK